MARRTQGTANGWKTCSRGHKYRGPGCPACWKGRGTKAGAVTLLAALLGAGCGSSGPADPSEVLAGRWELVTITAAGQAATTIADPARFTVTFGGDDRVSVRADCNSCGGAFSAAGSTLDIGPGLACTRVFCASAPLDTTFVTLLEAADRWSEDGGDLVLGSAAGTLRFRR